MQSGFKLPIHMYFLWLPSILFVQWHLLGFLILAIIIYARPILAWNILLLSIQTLSTLQNWPQLPPIPRPSPFAAVFIQYYLLFIFSYIHNNSTNIYWVTSMLQMLSSPKHEFLFQPSSILSLWFNIYCISSIKLSLQWQSLCLFLFFNKEVMK